MTKLLLYCILFALCWPLAIILGVCWLTYQVCALTVRVLYYMTKGGLESGTAVVKAWNQTEESAAQLTAKTKTATSKPKFVNERGQAVR